MSQQHLKQSVLAGGVIYSAGTPATDELLEKIPSEFWDGDQSGSKSAPAHHAAKKTAAKKTPAKD